MLLTYRVERRNERWWAAQSKVTGYEQRMQGYGTTRAEAVQRIKEICTNALIAKFGPSIKLEQLEFVEDKSWKGGDNGL